MKDLNFLKGFRPSGVRVTKSMVDIVLTISPPGWREARVGDGGDTPMDDTPVFDTI